MVQIALSLEEARMLKAILESYFSDLRMEIAGTENMNFREELKKQEVFLRKLLQDLEEKNVSG